MESIKTDILVEATKENTLEAINKNTVAAIETDTVEPLRPPTAKAKVSLNFEVLLIVKQHGIVEKFWAINK